ncbi:hypothetical protein ZHAS_00004122 [Anopheles sinensis]|uniref:Uncharacterized protein n=1 Tax=Anopheles sinensis TaxID=74873 RepID=A0A084VG54_ANOSI|nr:hypothetical protein ZHAS_00004122 [Anopheles sinensis]
MRACKAKTPLNSFFPLNASQISFFSWFAHDGQGDIPTKTLVQNSIRLPLAGLAPPRVLMCSASMGAEGSVTLQLREAVPAPDATGSLDGALTIGYPDSEMLADMLGTFQGASTGGADSDGGSFDLLQDSGRTAAEQIEHILTKSAASSSSSLGKDTSYLAHIFNK